MIHPIKNTKSIKTKEKDYRFTLYSFERPSDFDSNDCLEGQSIIFISERYEKEGKFYHNILYFVCTNDLKKVVSMCDWAVLNGNNANCIGVMSIPIDMDEKEVISDLLESGKFPEIESIPIIDSEEIFFLQGNEDFFEKVTAENKLQVVKDKIKEFFNMKNVNFLFGSGTSSPAIPVMRELLTAIREHKMADGENELFERIAKVKNNNIEEILGTLYSQKAFFDGIGDKESSDRKLCENLIRLIEEAIYQNLTPKLESEEMDDKCKDVLENYK